MSIAAAAGMDAGDSWISPRPSPREREQLVLLCGSLWTLYGSLWLRKNFVVGAGTKSINSNMRIKEVKKYFLLPVALLLIIICGAKDITEETIPNNEAQRRTTDTIIKFAADPSAGFNFEYLVYLPKGLRSDSAAYLLVETTNTGLNDTIAHHEKGARYAAGKSSVGNYISKKLRIPLLVPIFPRSQTKWQVYTHALDKDAFLSKEDGMERLDLQLLAMVKDARAQLSKKSYLLKEKFFITGFSASGTFANRFSILHPDKIQATASGGINAIAILPIASLEGKALNFPLGIADIEQVTGRKVKMNEFRKLPKMLYMGNLDDNDAAGFDDAYSEEERQIIYQLMGQKMIPDRWEFMQQQYKKSKVQADFRTCPDIGHGTDKKINEELVEFFREHSQ
jgi:hypothetical protein